MIVLLDILLVKSHTPLMTTADKVTSVRLILAPFFFIVFFLPQWLGLTAGWTVPVLWVLFIVSEITDLLDGKIARSRNQVSDFGKLYDPFSDTLVRITYFLCFVVAGILPALLLAVVLYREFGILFMRSMLMGRGVALGARSGGKIKAVAYMVTGIVALLVVSLQRLDLLVSLIPYLQIGAVVCFAISVLLSLTSFFDYVKVFKKTMARSEK